MSRRDGRKGVLGEASKKKGGPTCLESCFVVPERAGRLNLKSDVLKAPRWVSGHPFFLISLYHPCFLLHKKKEYNNLSSLHFVLFVFANMSKPTTSLDLSRHSDDKPTFQHGHHHHHDNNSNNTLTNKDSDITLAGNYYGATNKEKAESIDIELASLSSDSLTKTAAASDGVLVDGPAYGWVVVFACFVYQMVSMGLCNSYGVFQV